MVEVPQGDEVNIEKPVFELQKEAEEVKAEEL
jgi:hypothetical protein